MKIGTKYYIKESNVLKFIDMSFSNEDIFNKIKKHGGWFIPLEIETFENTQFVTKVKMADGDIFGNASCKYFELAEEEFCMFDEVSDEVFCINSINITVTPENAENAINLIKNTFNK